MIKIQTNSKEVAKRIGEMATKQFPFATARALTWTVKDAQKEVQRELPFDFTIRNNHVKRGIRITPANKRTLRAEVGSIDDFMALQAEGGIKRPKGRRLAIPVNARRNKKDIIRRPHRPRSILAKKDHFKGRTRSGREAIFKRMPGHRLSLVYMLEPSARIKPRFNLEKTVNQVVQERFDRLFTLSMNDAVGR